jgi:peptide/nickel transport system permease protein
LPWLVPLLFAELFASDLPLLARVDGKTYVLPNLILPRELRLETNASLRERVHRERSGWVLEPLVPFGPIRPSPYDAFQAPGREHLLGTDELGRDVLSRLIHGARVSLWVALLAVGIALVLGGALGAWAGHRRGATDAVVSRAIDALQVFPTLFLALAVVTATGGSLTGLIGVIALSQGAELARLVRNEVRRVEALPFVQASRLLGLKGTTLVWRHVLPHVWAPLWTAATLGVASAVMLESGLSFLGFGVPPPTASWGELLSQARQFAVVTGAWWLAVFPGLCIATTVAVLHWLGRTSAHTTT